MKLPEEYKILPSSLEFKIPFFNKMYRDGDFVLSLKDRDTEEWYREFIIKIENAIIGKQFLPICRMSDGEFIFCTGERMPSIRTGFYNRAAYYIRRKLSKLIKGNGFRANTLPDVPSGKYSNEERLDALPKYAENIKKLSSKGILALDYTYWDIPFQEQYFKPFAAWLDENDITINSDNYFPFYFVYAALLGPDQKRLLKGKNILVVHSAKNSKQERIKNRLLAIGALNVGWLNISPDRSLYDIIDINEILVQPDIILVGAGVGKPNILLQLEQLNVPCIDAGYVFEVWNDDANKWKRRYCVDDSEYDISKIEF